MLGATDQDLNLGESCQMPHNFLGTRDVAIAGTLNAE
jgi:hypothetical protein